MKLAHFDFENTFDKNGVFYVKPNETVEVNSEFYMVFRAEKPDSGATTAVIWFKTVQGISEVTSYDFINYTYEVDNADDNFKADVMRRFNLTPKAVEGLKRFKIITQHKIKTGENTVEFPLNFLFESNGTKKILCYAPLIYDALINGKTIVIDEMDNGLHHEMMKYAQSRLF